MIPLWEYQSIIPTKLPHKRHICNSEMKYYNENEILLISEILIYFK